MKHPAFEVEKNFTRQHGIQFIVLRMGTPLPEQVTEFLKIVNTPTNQPVLVHRWHGTVRTGALVAIYRVKEEG
jgi:protein tyrosine/serine phosphatase